ncbi:MAG: asparagine synthase [Planctomycetes bacterium]|nr:asparagine synthase [Planctomycetota bacterium]
MTSSTLTFNNFCLSSYLAFRYVVEEGIKWRENIVPTFPKVGQQSQICVSDAAGILAALRDVMEENCKDDQVGILLSSGIDSAILAALMPSGCKAYTIQFAAENAIDESDIAKDYSQRCGLEHHIVQVRWEDYLENMDTLMFNKNSPLHPVEVALYKAACKAKADGVQTLVIGNGADSTFGGMDKLLSKDWTFDEFVKRYTFVEPDLVLKEAVSMVPSYEEYKIDDGIDVIKFLKFLHGTGIIQAFDNAIGLAGCKTIEPFEQLFLDAPLDLDRIRNGESKYLLREVFKELYPDMDIPEKIAFSRPMDQWLKDWTGPNRNEFKDDIDIGQFSGDQKFIIYCLEHFLNCFDKV